APMAGSVSSAGGIAVAGGGGLGSLPGAVVTKGQGQRELDLIREGASRPINVNFFFHPPPRIHPHRDPARGRRLERYYVELGLDPGGSALSSARTPFDGDMCDLVIEAKPEVVSFHFGLPERGLLARVKATGAKILSSATSVDEARWLENEGCDAIIAQ